MVDGQRMDLEELRTARPRALFIDDGGVLNDNARRGREWPRLIGEFMPPRLGGTAEAWATANRRVFPAIWSDLQRWLPQAKTQDEFRRAYATRWLRAICARLRIEPPADEQAISLHGELCVYVAERAGSAIEGAREAVLALRRAGYELYTASGTPSTELRGIMAKMELPDAFTTLYGPDIVDRVKHGAPFYETVFRHAGVSAGSVLVIDSDDACCAWAVAAGARSLRVDPSGGGDAASLEALLPYLT
ncbi:MAG: hypothetical protein IVW36_06025 [Dehalococcoidia bacterium]|nr:hypothetical protein [Dehalococcoidia bacterium]